MEGSAILEVFRDLSYPLGVGSYDAYAIPRRAYIVAIEKNDAGLRISADVERIEKLQRSYAIVREPFGRSSAGTSRAEVLVCRYLVVATDGEVLIAGRGRLGEDGIFAVDLNGELLPGMYTLMVALYLDGNTMNPDIKRISYRVTGNAGDS